MNLTQMKRFLEPIWYYPIQSLICFLMPVSYGLFFGSTPLILDIIVKALDKKDIISFHTNVYIFIAMMVVVVIMITPFHLYVRKKWSIQTRKVIYEQYTQKYIEGDNVKCELIGTGKANSITQKGVDTRMEQINKILGPISRIIITIGFSLYLIYDKGGTLVFLISLGLFVLTIVLTTYIAHLCYNYRKKVKEIITEADRLIIKIFMSKFEILTSQKLGIEHIKMGKLFDERIKTLAKENLYNAFIGGLPRIIIDIARILSLRYIGHGILQGTHTVGDLLVYQMILSLLRGNMFDLNEILSEFQANQIHVEKLRETYDNIGTMNIYIGKQFIPSNISLTINNMTFGYNLKNNVFENFSLDIQTKKKTAFVGPSGGGKSTLIKLIAAYLKPDSGYIYVDGHELSKVSLFSYYKHIGYLTQEPSIFDGTIRENLEYGIQANSEYSELSEIISKAQCQFIYDLPNGLDTEVGERGVRLSGGQKQRLAIARIFAKNPSIIILDEPTSALDSFAEEEITKAMHELCKEKTVLIIAHRLQTVKEADMIIYIDQGKIIESGSHEDLVLQNGKYKKMLDLQSGF